MWYNMYIMAQNGNILARWLIIIKANNNIKNLFILFKLSFKISLSSTNITICTLSPGSYIP